jgi:nucleoid-associated protein YgaU
MADNTNPGAGSTPNKGEFTYNANGQQVTVSGSNTKIKMDDYILSGAAFKQYDNVHQLDGIQTDPAEMKTINFKQDYVVIIRKKLFYAATTQLKAKTDPLTGKVITDENGKPVYDDPSGNYVRVYQVNNFINLSTSHNVNGKMGSCRVTIKGGERVICADRSDQDDKGWADWKTMLYGWTNVDDEGTVVADYGQGVGDEIVGTTLNQYSYTMNDDGTLKFRNSTRISQLAKGTKWSVGQKNWKYVTEGGGSVGVDFKNLLKAREAKYGWKFAEKCDWEPMDEIWVLGKSMFKRDGDQEIKDKDGNVTGIRSGDGKFQFCPIFFGYIDAVQKTYQAGKGGLLVNIQASDHLKLLDISRVTNYPTITPGLTNNNQGLDIRWPQDNFGCFLIHEPFVNMNRQIDPATGKPYDEASQAANNADTAIYQTYTNVFGGKAPDDIIRRLCVDAGIPKSFLTDRIEPIKVAPFVSKIRGQSMDLFGAADLKTRLSVCVEAANKLFVEFFADEEGNIVFKIPNWALGVNRMKANNMGLDFDPALLDMVGYKLVDTTPSGPQSPLGPAPTSPTSSTTPDDGTKTLSTKTGDTLEKLAQDNYGDATKWEKIYNDNPDYQSLLTKDGKAAIPDNLPLKIYPLSSTSQVSANSRNYKEYQVTKDDDTNGGLRFIAKKFYGDEKYWKQIYIDNRPFTTKDQLDANINADAEYFLAVGLNLRIYDLPVAPTPTPATPTPNPEPTPVDTTTGMKVNVFDGNRASVAGAYVIPYKDGKTINRNQYVTVKDQGITINIPEGTYSFRVTVYNTNNEVLATKDVNGTIVKSQIGTLDVTLDVLNVNPNPKVPGLPDDTSTGMTVKVVNSDGVSVPGVFVEVLKDGKPLSTTQYVTVKDQGAIINIPEGSYVFKMTAYNNDGSVIATKEESGTVTKNKMGLISTIMNVPVTASSGSTTPQSTGDGDLDKLMKDGYIKYTTKSGDCFWFLAERFYQDGERWLKIWNDNKDQPELKGLLDDPNLLPENVVLTIYDIDRTSPPAAIPESNGNKSGELKSGSAVYTVVEGDTLWDIAVSYYGDGTKWEKIFNDNLNRPEAKLDPKDPNWLEIGATLVIQPDGSSNNTDPTKKVNAIVKTQRLEKSAGTPISAITDPKIPVIKPEYIMSFTLNDTDREVYNVFEVAMEMDVVDLGRGPQEIRRAIPDLGSIVRFGLRPHPAIINTPLIKNLIEAEIFGIMLTCKSLANRYSGTLTMIEESSIKVGNPIRFFMYDDHPNKPVKKINADGSIDSSQLMFPTEKAQAVFYVTGIERTIAPNNVSSMSLTLKAGRMMGQESIYDICLPLYSMYYDGNMTIKLDDSVKEYEDYYVKNGYYEEYSVQPRDTIRLIILNHYGNVPKEKKMEIIKAIVVLNPEKFGPAGGHMFNFETMDMQLFQEPKVLRLPLKDKIRQSS